MIEINQDKKIGITLTLSGEFSFKNVKEELQSIYANEEFKNLKYLILDRTNSINYNLKSNQFHELISLNKSASEINNNLLLIFISGSNFEYGMGRQFELLMDGIGWQVYNFKDKHQADAIIN